MGYALVVAASVGLWVAFWRWQPEVVAELAARDMELGSPELLWLLLLLPFVWAVRLHTLTDLPLLQQVVGALVRSALIVALVGALADPRLVEEDPKKVATVFLVDASDSVQDAALDRARVVLQEAWDARGDAGMRLVVFAETPREVPLDPEAARVPALVRPPDAAGTDLQAALRMAYGMLPDGVTHRVVLLSDGNETRGNLLAESETARRFGVQVFTRAFPEVAPRPEMLVRGLTVPDGIKERVPFAVTARVESSVAGRGRCVLRVDETETAADVDLVVGEATVRFDEVRVDEGGTKRLVVECTSEAGDRFASNNRWESVVEVPKKPRVLYVEGEARTSRDLVAALSEDFDVDLRGPAGIPGNAAELGRYDLVVVSDVPVKGAMGRENFGYAQMQAVEAYVRRGGAFVMAGGPDSFGPGGYGGTILERNVLPVRLDAEKEKDTPGLALMLVIDRSGSMSGQKIELAKEAAKATLEVLQRDDQIGVVAFDNEPMPVVRLQSASNRMRIINNLSKITAGGGTAILPALDVAFEELRDSNAQVKHVILLTDGQASREGIESLVGRMYRGGITVTTVAVGESADRDLLEQIAALAGGRYYSTNDANNIPKIFMKETTQVSRTSVVEEHFRPRVEPRFSRLQVLRGLGALPPLLGYVSTKAKPRAEVILTTHRGEPLLARWRLGLGWVFVWTSDVKARWSYPWVRWKGYAQFWRQLVRDAMRSEQEQTYDMTATVERGVLRVEVDAVDEGDRFVNGLDARARVTLPGGDVKALGLSQTASGRYEGTMAVSELGAYRIDAELRARAGPERGTGGGGGQGEAGVEGAGGGAGADGAAEVEGTAGDGGAPGGAEAAQDAAIPARAAVSYPYPDEHALADRVNAALLARVAALTGASSDPGAEELFRPTGEVSRRTTPRHADLLWLALFLLVADVLLRRVRLWRAGEVAWRR